VHDERAEIERGLQLAREKPLSERVSFWSKQFLGRPYIAGPLNDSDRRFRLDGFDCMTFVETCIALGLSKSFDEILPNLDAIRYYGARPSFETRKHFISIDWISGNSGLIRPMDEPADSVCEKAIDRRKVFEVNKLEPSADFALPLTEIARMPFISKQKIPSAVAGLPDFSVILFVGGVEWTVVSHMGFAVKADSACILRHASSRAGAVVEIDLIEYLDSRPSLSGATFLSLL